jgi:sterol desaturase/sphingolipid hydroxylase (fatty acid hydroxylase superfamily)
MKTANEKLEKLFPWTGFPVLLMLAVALHVSMVEGGAPLQLATYVPVLLAAALVTLFELRFPHQARWRPDKADVGDDLLFMTIVQLALPVLVVITFTFALVAPARALELPIAALWPHSLPVPVQVLAMILLVDLLHYCLHRSAHTFGFLWRFHQVHHSPEKLYWLNVGRFHPVEKVLQMFMDTLPFLLLAVNEQVIAAYFVIYATNGFFKHSNVSLRFGPLNYVLSTAELHRWHHSRIPEESNRNYGNVTILWDLLFGTWYLPKSRQITDIGLRDQGFPKRFPGQVAAPLAPMTAAIAGAGLELRKKLRTILTRLVMTTYAMRYWLPVRRAAADPRKTQERVLRGILARNRETTFGLLHGFGETRSPRRYAHNVPVCTYERLRPWIEAQDVTADALLSDENPIMYASTSGTTGDPKYIPVLRSTLRDYVRDQRLFSYLQYRNCPGAFTGKVFAVGSPAIEGHLPSGTPYGSLSGHIYDSMPAFVKANYVLPAGVFAIEDYDLKYEVMLRLALAEPGITYMGAANPSSFLRLQTLLNECAEEMAGSLDSGKLGFLDTLPREIRETIESRLSPERERADELRRLAARGHITFADLWPDIRLLTTWTSGSCGIALDALRATLPEDTMVLDLGYLSSEFRGTVTSDASIDGGIPTIHRHFFEFVERDTWDRGERNYLLIDELETGREYYILVTTGSGLYRYFMNDIVRVTGFYRRTPTIRFVQKGKGVTNITGEKVYEGQVVEAVKRTEKSLKFSSIFYLMLADEEMGGYSLYLEPRDLPKGRTEDVAQALDDHLSQLNIEYRAKRASARLAPLDVRLLADGSADDYKRFCLSNGQREGQFKPVTLQYRSEIAFPLERYLSGGDREDCHAY